MKAGPVAGERVVADGDDDGPGLERVRIEEIETGGDPGMLRPPIDEGKDEGRVARVGGFWYGLGAVRARVPVEGPREGGAKPPRPRHCNRGRNPRMPLAVRLGRRGE